MGRPAGQFTPATPGDSGRRYTSGLLLGLGHNTTRKL
jgi:hypothetical protein